MKQRKRLGDVIHFSTGVNPSRIKGKVSEGQIYSLEDFDRDLVGMDIVCEPLGETAGIDPKVCTQMGDCIISLTRSQAGVVTGQSSGKVITANFVKCHIDVSQMDTWYFCYIFNESKQIRKQMNQLQQGVLSCISKLNINTVSQMEYDYKSLEHQKMIGAMYREIMKQNALMKKQTDQITRTSLMILESMD